jgi:hypothetical protein
MTVYAKEASKEGKSYIMLHLPDPFMNVEETNPWI